MEIKLKESKQMKVGQNICISIIDYADMEEALKVI